jgi:hypothetical protein
MTIRFLRYVQLPTLPEWPWPTVSIIQSLSYTMCQIWIAQHSWLDVMPSWCPFTYIAQQSCHSFLEKFRSCQMDPTIGATSSMIWAIINVQFLTILFKPSTSERTEWRAIVCTFSHDKRHIVHYWCYLPWEGTTQHAVSVFHSICISVFYNKTHFLCAELEAPPCVVLVICNVILFTTFPGVKGQKIYIKRHHHVFWTVDKQ